MNLSILVFLCCSLAFAQAIEWTADLEKALRVVSAYPLDTNQKAAVEHLLTQKSLEGLNQKALGSIRVTGYYTPVVYSREKAERHAKMQGSALFKNREGRVRLMSYRGKREGQAIYRLLGDVPRGASGMPLVAGYSAAVNPTQIPYGTILLTEIDGKPVVLIAQDTGGRVQRRNEIDVYTGVGESARQKALKLHTNREVFVLAVAEPEPMPEELPSEQLEQVPI